jgi:hypothetical protein
MGQKKYTLPLLNLKGREVYAPMNRIVSNAFSLIASFYKKGRNWLLGFSANSDLIFICMSRDKL